MFGEKIDNNITMIQRLVALMRDLVITIIAGLTTVIIYFHGNPTQLTALDWTKLVADVPPASVHGIIRQLGSSTLPAAGAVGKLETRFLAFSKLAVVGQASFP